MRDRWLPRRASLVVNAASRTGEQGFSTAVARLREMGVPLHSAYPLHDPSRLPETVREALHEGCDLVVLGGGDGSVSSVVDVLADQGVALGLLPLGTANDFARTLDIPFDVKEACENVVRGKVVDVDLGLAGQNHYVNVASVGLSVAVTHALSPRLKKLTGAMAYPVAAVKAFREHEPFSARLSFPDGDHETVELEGLLQLAVGNGRFYGGGMVVAPPSGIDDQILDVYAIERGRRRDLIGLAYNFKSGDFVHGKNARHYRTSKVLLETEPELSVNLDGEVEARTPKLFSVAHNALRVIVPQTSTAARDDTAGEASWSTGRSGD